MDACRPIDVLYYFGRFNFPHVGYAFLIESALKEVRPTTGIVLIPSNTSATWGKTAIPFPHRVRMLELLLQTLPKDMRPFVSISDIENRTERLSGRTIDTLIALTNKKNQSVGILLGADSALGTPPDYKGIRDWYRFAEIAARARIVIGPRGIYSNTHLIRKHMHPQVLATNPILLTSTPSTLEQHAASSLVLEGAHEYLPPSVLRYAQTQRLLLQ